MPSLDQRPQTRHSSTVTPHLRPTRNAPTALPDYVVNGFSDYRENGYGGDGISQRIVGLLFHDTAEIAAKEQAAERAEWYAICERLAGQRRATDELPVAKECIDRYFDLDLSGWEIVDAEREFQLEVDDHELVGFIDAVYRTPDGELVVIDYKATERHRDIDENKAATVPARLS